ALRGAPSGAPVRECSRSANPRQSRHPHAFSSVCQVASKGILTMTKATSETTLEQSLLHVSDLLRCAAATAYETGDSLNGPKRDLAFSAVHLIEMARTELDRSLVSVEAR